MTDRAERAAALFASGFNCTQSVLAAYAEDFSLEETAATRLGEGLGGAFLNGANMPCGALLGAIMVLGLYAGRAQIGDIDAKLRTMSLQKRAIAAFSERCGASTCRELLGGDITTPEGAAKARAEGRMKNCASYVATACEVLDELLASHQ